MKETAVLAVLHVEVAVWVFILVLIDMEVFSNINR